MGVNPECDEAREILNAALDSALRAFAKWMASAWKVPATKEAFEKELGEYPGDSYVTGYNVGVESAEAAVEAFLEDQYR